MIDGIGNFLDNRTAMKILFSHTHDIFVEFFSYQSPMLGNNNFFKNFQLQKSNDSIQLALAKNSLVMPLDKTHFLSIRVIFFEHNRTFGNLFLFLSLSFSLSHSVSLYLSISFSCRFSFFLFNSETNETSVPKVFEATKKIYIINRLQNYYKIDIVNNNTPECL